MAELSDAEVFGPKQGEASDAEVFGQPEPPPRPFLDRLMRGDALKRAVAPMVAAGKGAAEGFGNEALGLSEEHVHQLMDAGVFRDPATGRGGALRLFNESVIMPASVLGDLAVRGGAAAIGAVAGAVGQFVEDAEGNLGNPEKAKAEVTNFLNYQMLRGDHQFGRVEREPTPTDQPIGIYPRDQDFKVSAEVLDRTERLKKIHEHIKQAGDFSQAPQPTSPTEQNLRDLWEQRGIHPAEAVADAKRDAFLKDELTTPPYNLTDRSGIAPVTNSPVPQGTPRSELARTGDERIDRILESDVTRHVVDNPVVDREHTIPYTAGGSVPLEDPTFFIDRRFPRSFTIDGTTFDPAEPFAVHENVEQHTMEMLIKGGMDPQTAYKIAHFEFAEKAEGAWYKAHGIDQEKAEAAYAPIMAQIQKDGASDVPSNLYKRPYPHDQPSAAKNEAIAEPKPTKAEIAQAHTILDAAEREMPLRAVGAEVTGDTPSLAAQPPSRPGNLLAAAKASLDKLFDIGRDAQMLVAPMARGTRDSMALAKDFANAMRRNRWEWSRVDEDIARRFTPEQRKRMWEAADEESVLRQEGYGAGAPPVAPGMIRLYRGEGEQQGRAAFAGSPVTGGWFTTDIEKAKLYGKVSYVDVSRDDLMHFATGHGGIDEYVTDNPSFRQRSKPFVEGKPASEHMGLATLTPEERRAVEELQTRAQLAWLHARNIGIVEGEGLPAYTPRMVINAAGVVSGDKALPLNVIGRNLKVTTPNLRQRKYMTAEETEAAAKAKYGEQAELARDIRALPLATAKLEDAIAGRTLIDNIKEYGRQTGDETIMEGGQPSGSPYKWFTLDHPAFKTWRPDFEIVDGQAKPRLDADGNPIFKQVPIYVRGDFEGPLRAVLTRPSGPLYSAAMSLKGKTMSLIMNSPLIHNAVEWGRALPAMPGKVATFRIYFQGNRAKNDPAVMRQAIDAGLVPIGHRFFNQDITSIMEEPSLTPGRSWTAKVLGAVPGLFDEGAGNAVKSAIDKAGDFWHNTLLWDRVADLQMGLYTNFHDSLLAKGVDQQTAARVAAHFANRYAGALPVEAMSDNARKISNMLLFSRSFTLGNLGAMKDMLTGLPKDVMAQIERDAGFRAGAINEAGELAGPAAEAVQYAKTLARRKAMAVVALDIGLMYVGNSILQSVINVMRGDHTMDQEAHGYVDRLHEMMSRVKEHPLSLLQPFSLMESLSSTSENEPGKQDRVKIGYAKDGTAIYMRNPAGKIGEEFVGYLTGPLDMIRRKLDTIARPGWQILSNDAGFGRKVYDPNADTPAKYVQNLGKIAEHLAKSQIPEGQINALSDLVKGEGDPKVNELQAFGPFGGMTFSKGAPGGPAVGEMYNARSMYEYARDAAMPDIRRQIQRGDIDGAMQRMTELHIPPPLQKFYIRTTMNPATRLSPKALRDFYQYATPEQRQRLENAR